MAGKFDERHLQREGRTISEPVHTHEYQRKGNKREAYVAMSEDERLSSVRDWNCRTDGNLSRFRKQQN
ncbi:hypothetical protein AJ78_00973 [Emergomyces pasteurianus Ep9510]|uniref:Uncharacterized protein n=1 Tax=Emergomyces pasteurianus Ep9510 TaxID=1447872 RepID=A0A1J9PS16_9EURO|nr:hypothetical protein AJ78_00973 [Emergomyces pasteurianus Ep9510]